MENLIILYATGIIVAGVFYFWMAHTKSGRKWLKGYEHRKERQGKGKTC